MDIGHANINGDGGNLKWRRLFWIQFLDFGLNSNFFPSHIELDEQCRHITSFPKSQIDSDECMKYK